MTRASKILSLVLISSTFLHTPVSFAQNGGSTGSDPTSGSPLEVRNAMGTILLSGLVGGILGLSTLSFYSEPQDNIRNIFFGAGAGMIIATLGMTFSVATSPLPSIDSAFHFVPLVSPSGGGLLVMHRF